MSEDTNRPGGHKPPRAQPLQPDKPGSGDGTSSSPPDDASHAEQTARDTARRQKQQSDSALDNVRDGYD